MSLKTSITLKDLKLYLRVDQDLEDDLIKRFMKAATNEAEGFLNTDFGGAEVPEEVDTWILNRVAEFYENRGQPLAPDFSFIQHLKVYPFRGIGDQDDGGGSTW